MNDDATMMDIIGTILSRLVNVALFLVISILALLFLRTNTEMSMGLVVVLAIAAGVVGTILIRLLLNALRRLAGMMSS